MSITFEIKNKEVEEIIKELRKDGVDLQEWFYYLVLHN